MNKYTNLIEDEVSKGGYWNPISDSYRLLQMVKILAKGIDEILERIGDNERV